MRTLITVAALTTLGITGFSCSIASGGTLGYWRFEDGSGGSAADSSGNGNSAGLTNGSFSSDVPVNPVPNTGFPNNGSIALTGSSSYLAVPHDSVLNPTSAITVEAWAKVDGGLQMPSNAGIAGTQYGNIFRDSFNIGIRNSNNSVFFEITNTSGIDAAAEYFTGLSPHTWYHLAGTYDGSTVRLYVNGSPVATAALSGNIGYSGNRSILIGADNEGAAFAPTWFFPGSIDEVRISDTVLEPSQMLVPEPSTLALGILGALSLVAFSRRTRRRETLSRAAVEASL